MSTEFAKTEKEATTVFGRRLLEAFRDAAVDDKKEIAEALGFRSGKAIYKVLNGQQELSFTALLAFADATGCSIHWLLTGQPPKKSEPYKALLELLGPDLATAVRERWELVEFPNTASRSQHWLTILEYIQKLVREGMRFEETADVRADPTEVVWEGARALKETFGSVVDSYIGNLWSELRELRRRSTDVIVKTEFLPMRRLAVVGEIAAGEAVEIVPIENEFVEVPESVAPRPNRDYAVLRVSGDSMLESGIVDGSFIVCERRTDPRNGEVVVALLNGSVATVKRFYKEKGAIRLEPANKQHQPIIVGPDTRLEIQGVVVWIFHKPY